MHSLFFMSTLMDLFINSQLTRFVLQTSSIICFTKVICMYAFITLPLRQWNFYGSQLQLKKKFAT